MAQVRTGYKRSLTVLITKSIKGSVADGYPKQYPTATDILNGYFTYMGIHYTIPTPEQLALMDQIDYNYLLLRFKQYIYFTETGFVSDDFSSDAEIYDPEECVEGIITTTTTTSEPTTTTTSTTSEPTTTTTSTTESLCESEDVLCDGQYQVIATDTELYVSDDFGGTFTAAEPANRTWRAVSTSSNGKYILLVSSATGLISISDDYGQTYFTRDQGDILYRGATMSNDGKYMAVCGINGGSDTGRLQISDDYGDTWSDVSGSTGLDWTRIRMSETGQYILALQSSDVEQVYISENYGASFTARGDSKYYYDVAIDRELTIYTTDGGDETGSDYYFKVKRSTDLGLNWTTLQQSYDDEFYRLDVSACGKYIITSGLSGVYQSDDYGSTFSYTSVGGATQDIRMSLSGKYRLVQRSTAYSYKSSDYGANWTQVSAQTNSAGVVINRAYQECSTTTTTTTE